MIAQWVCTVPDAMIGDDTLIHETQSISTRGRVRKLRYDFRDLLGGGTPAPIPGKRKRPNTVFYSDKSTLYTTQVGVVSREDLMIFCVRGVVRLPPLSTVQRLIEWNEKFDFGLSLRRCTNPDFISRAVIGEADGDCCGLSRDSVEKSSSWLLPAISVDLDSVLQRIPLPAAGHLLLLTAFKILQRFQQVGLFRQVSSVSNDLLQTDTIDFANFQDTATIFVTHTEDFALDAKLLFSLASRVMDTLYPVSELKKQLLQVILLDLASSRYDRRRAAKIVLRVLGNTQSKDLERSEVTALLLRILSNESELKEINGLLQRYCGSSAEYADLVCDSITSAIKIEPDTSTLALYVDILLQIRGLSGPIPESLTELLGTRSRIARAMLSDIAVLEKIEPLVVRIVEAIEKGVEYGGVVTKLPISSKVIADRTFIALGTTLAISLSAVKALLHFLAIGSPTELSSRIVSSLKMALSGCSTELLIELKPSISALLSANDASVFSVVYSIPLPILLNTINDFLISTSDNFLVDFSRQVSSHDINGIQQIIDDSGVKDLSFLLACFKSYECNGFTKTLERLISAASSSVHVTESVDSDVAMEVVGHSSKSADDESTPSFDLISLNRVVGCILQDARTQHENGIPLVFNLVEKSCCQNKGVVAAMVTKCCLDNGFGDQLIDFILRNDEGLPLERSVVYAVFHTLYKADNSTLSKSIFRSLSRMDVHHAQLNFIFAYGAFRILFRRKFPSWREFLGGLLDFMLIVEGEFDDADIDFLSPCTRSDLAHELPLVLVKIVSSGDIFTFSY